MSGSNSSVPATASPPDQPVSFTVHSLPAAHLDAEAQRTRSGRAKMLLVLLACAAPVIGSYLAYFVVRPEGRINYAALIEPTRPLPDTLPLVDLDGRTVPAASLRQQWLLAVVAGGACDAACEQALYLQRQLREALGRERDRLDKVWFVVDDAPVRPEVRAAVSQGTSPAWVLRVPRPALEQWLQPAAGRTLEQHYYIVDPMGEWMMRAPREADPARLKRDIERLLRASGFWDQPGRPSQRP
jgi:hypothetical protein